MSGSVTYFLGSNSPDGFSSLYDQLLPLDRARRIYLLKGGPGCGKSTLMKEVSAALAETGQPVEYIRCSGDPESLDAVLFPELGVALTDATAPHVQEPRLPGVVESYVDLGRFYDHSGLLPLRREIQSSTTIYKGHYGRAYRCLTAAAQLMEDDRAALSTPVLDKKLQKRVRGILSRECKPRQRPCVPGAGKERFLGSVSCQGISTCFETVESQCKRVYVLQDSYHLAAPALEELWKGFRNGGYDGVLCRSPLFPQRLEHLLLPELGLAFVTATQQLPYPGRSYRRVRVDAMIDPQLLRLHRSRLRLSKKVTAALLNEAVAALAQAKAEHDKLEKLYNPHVDFAGVHAQAQDILRELLELQEQVKGP